MHAKLTRRIRFVARWRSSGSPRCGSSAAAPWVLCAIGLFALAAALAAPAWAQGAEDGSPPAPTLAAQSPAAAQPLRVMTFNIRYGTAPDGENAWEHRQDLLARTILAFDPDLLGTQECLQLQVEFLQAALLGRGFVGVGRDDGRQAGEMAAIFYRAERFEKLAEGHFWLSETPEQVASKSWDAALTRIVSWAKLREKPSGRELVFFNTHFDHMGQVARRESAALLAQKAREIAGDLPVILTGDFNADADPMSDGPYRVLLGVGGAASDAWIKFTDTYRAAHPRREKGEGTYNSFTGDTAGPRIDWILTSAGWTALEAGIDRTRRDRRYPSDHFPVTAVLMW